MRNIASLKHDSPDWRSWQEARAIAHRLTHGRMRDPTGGATHFAQGPRPAWARHMRRVSVVGRYAFFREPPDQARDARPSARRKGDA
jgi:spore germination cell wall hydrolase CwlJ-like protein